MYTAQTSAVPEVQFWLQLSEAYVAGSVLLTVTSETAMTDNPLKPKIA
jgi:hypothetical protein